MTKFTRRFCSYPQAMGMVLEAVRQPVINGYLIAGSIVGPGGLKLIKVSSDFNNFVTWMYKSYDLDAVHSTVRSFKLSTCIGTISSESTPIGDKGQQFSKCHPSFTPPCHHQLHYFFLKCLCPTYVPMKGTVAESVPLSVLGVVAGAGAGGEPGASGRAAAAVHSRP